MRNLKKVLTLVLTLAMLLSVMVVGAGAAVFNDQDSIKNTQAVDVCTTLKIIDGINGSFKPNDNVTRAQMCKMICVALNGGNNANMGSNVGNTFADVTTGYWGTPFIEYCVREKVAAGVGGGNFNPEGNVTGSQAAKMLLVILGYDPAIQGYVGSNAWELNINSDAAKKGLYAGIETIDPSAPLSRDNAAQMIWNALQANEVWYTNSMILGPNGTMVPVAQDKVVGTTNDKISLLSDKYDANIAVGTFAGNGVNRSDLNDGEARITDAMINGRTVYDSNNQQTQKAVTTFPFKSDFDLKYIGEEVMVLYKDGLTGIRGQLDTKDDVFGTFLTGASTVYNISKADLQNAPDNKDKIKFGDVEHDANPLANGGIDVYLNYSSTNENTVTSGTGDKGAKDFDNVAGTYYETCGDTIKFIEENGKIVAAYITEYSIGRVTATASDKISVSGLKDSLRFVDNEIDSGLERDDVVLYRCVYDSNTYIVEKATPVAGKLDSYNFQNVGGITKGTITVSGTAYDRDVNTGDDLPIHFNTLGGADGFKDLDDLTSNDLNCDVEAYVLNGCVLALRMVNTNTNYALVDAIDDGDGSNLKPYHVFLVMSDGTTGKYQLSADSALKGDDIGTLVTGTDKLLVTYTLTSGNQVKLNLATEGLSLDGSNNVTGTADELDHAIYSSADKKLYNYDTVGSNNVSKGIVASDCVLFVHTGDSASGAAKYKVYTNVRGLSSINADDKGSLYGLYGKDDGNIVVAYLDLGSKPSGADSVTRYGIVTSIGKAWSKDGVNYSEYEVFANNEPMKITYANDEKTAMIDCGDLIFFDEIADGIYETGDITIIAKDGAASLTSSGAWNNGKITGEIVQIESYDEANALLTYAAGAATADENGIDWSSRTSAKVASNVVIAHVDAKGDDKGNTTTDIRAIAKKKDDGTYEVKNNAVIIKDSEGIVVAIYVDDNFDIQQ